MVDNISLVSLYENNIIIMKELKIVTNVTQLDKFINQLEYEGQTIIGEQGKPCRLSGGQKNKGWEYRGSLYINREILIFDEATSALDGNTEDKILSELFSQFNSKTIIFVTHKQKILNYFDEIFEIKNKKICKD